MILVRNMLKNDEISVTLKIKSWVTLRLKIHNIRDLAYYSL